VAYIQTRMMKDGPRYDVRYDVNGERRTERFRFEKDAKAYLTKIRGDALAGLILDPRGGERLFGAYAEEWLEHRLVKGRPLTLATRQGYEALLRRNLRPAFGKTMLRQITPNVVRKWHSKLVADKGADAAAKSYRLLRAILMTAVSDELIPRNPCTIKGAGIERAGERPLLETAMVLHLADAITPRLRALVMLGGFASLRPGELLGLQRRDVSLLHRTVHVERQAHEITGRGRVETPPKSEAGERTVVLPEFVAGVMAEHFDAYVAPAPSSPVFTRPSGLPLRRADLSNEWRAACATVGLSGVRPHDLRHHAATLTARKPGITLRELMATIGHSSPVAALRYQHATEERSREIASFLDEAIAAAKGTPTSSVVRLRP
jgi:integrase